ncbi:pyridoxal phosphate-dependent transferase [Zopfochytrium polystomum]|nr:pyridoxal phosphate-dependent transferase [Zopfochytrium polystomum]
MEDRYVSDQEVLDATQAALSRFFSAKPSGLAFVETAGGVHSPTISGSLQSDAYRHLRLPVVLIGDSKLGGISTTLSAYESLVSRGYSVPLVMLFSRSHGNEEIIRRNVDLRECAVSTVAPPPPAPSTGPPSSQAVMDYTNMLVYYESIDKEMMNAVQSLVGFHEDRVQRLESMASRAEGSLWWPFTQHTRVSATTVIDAAYGDNWDVYRPSPKKVDALRAQGDVPATPASPETADGGELTAVFDGSASWWTQALGHGNPQLAAAAAKAAGRYGHVLFPECVHEPALALAERLLETVGRGWATRVFYSDNGSTAVEVALKMALKRAEDDRLVKHSKMLDVVGVCGGYHGDTIGAMNASNPNVYNDKVNWYSGRGCWFEPPQVIFKNGKYSISLPPEMKFAADNSRPYPMNSKQDVFKASRIDEDPLASVYREHIEVVLTARCRSGAAFGAAVIEPVLLGAGGMVWVDPLFQRVLMQTLRSPRFIMLNGNPVRVIFDEVFVGLHRIGPVSTQSLLHERPDIACYAKEVFQGFLSQEKTEALLHGHSYTAHPVGCQVALETLRTLEGMERLKDDFFSLWSSELVDRLSHHKKVERVVALGSVLAMELVSAEKGYGVIGDAMAIATKLREHGVFLRPMGNALYLVGSLNANQAEAEGVLNRIVQELDLLK